jgi:ribosomal-protein-alanine N-acetyltransferase
LTQDVPDPDDMTAADLAAVEALERLSTPSPWPERAFRAELSNAAARCRLIRMEGRVAAFAVAWHLPGESQVAELAVHPDFRRRGLARRLVREVLEDARARGAAVVTLEVREGNAAARRLYESFGFSTTGRRKKYYEDREDALLMQKDLGPGR